MPVRALITYALSLIAILLLCAGNCFCQSNEYLVLKKGYGQLDGLPDKNINCGLQDAEGFLWFGTGSGLCRYDGKKFLLFTVKTHGLLSNNIIGLAADDGSHIIITYGQTGTSQISLQQRQALDINTLKLTSLKEAYPALPFDEKRCVATFNSGEGKPGFVCMSPSEIWLYSTVGGFQKKFAGAKALKEVFLENTWRSYVLADSNRCALGRPGFILLMNDKQNYSYKADEHFGLISLFGDGFLLYYRDPANSLIDSFYTVLPGKGRVACDPFSGFKKQIKKKKIVNACPSNGNSSIIHLSDASVWLFEPGMLIELFTGQDPDEPEVLEVNSYFKDAQGDYWMCTTNGLFRVKLVKNRFTLHYTRKDPRIIMNNSTRGIYANGDTLVANMFDYFAFKTGTSELLLLKRQSCGLYRDKEEFLVGSFDIRSFDPRSKAIQLQAKSRNGREIWNFFPLNEKGFLLGCTNGIYLYTKGDSLALPVSDNGFPHPKFVYRFFRDRSGQLLAVAGNGVYVLTDKGTIADYYGADAAFPAKKLPCHDIYDVYEDKEGICWIATNSEGLYRWNRQEHTFLSYDMQHGFLSNTVYCIQQDNYNNLWLSTGYGLVRFNKKTLQVKTFSEEDGISDNEFNRGSAFKDKTGRIWFGGVNGITSFLPEDFLSDTLKETFPFVITEATWYNANTETTENIRPALLEGTTLVVAPGTTFLTLHFSLLDFEERRYRYAYMLEGVDKDWTYSHESSLRYTDLPYGTYTLRIKAQTANGYWNGQEIRIPLEVQMPFYKTWWFVALIVLALIALVSAIAFLVFRQKLKHLSNLNNLRVKLASDLHDEVGGLLNKTAMQSEMARAGANDATKALLDRIADNCRRAMSGMRDIMWNLDSRNDTATDLLDRIREYAMNMLNDSFDYSVKAEGMENLKLHPEIKQAVYLICKEAINNMVKHAEKGKAEIRLSVNEHKIRLTVYNETSFRQKEVSTGQGMRNMQMRAEKLKGTFRIDTAEGVCVIVEIPLKSHLHVT